MQGAGALIGCHARLAGHVASGHKPRLDLLHSGAVLTPAAVTARSRALPKLSLLLPLGWCPRSSLRPKPLPSLPLRPWQAALQGNMQELQMLRKQRDALDDQIQRLEWQLSKTAEGGRSHSPQPRGQAHEALRRCVVPPLSGTWSSLVECQSMDGLLCVQMKMWICWRQSPAKRRSLRLQTCSAT